MNKPLFFAIFIIPVVYVNALQVGASLGTNLNWFESHSSMYKSIVRPAESIQLIAIQQTIPHIAFHYYISYERFKIAVRSKDPIIGTKIDENGNIVPSGKIYWYEKIFFLKTASCAVIPSYYFSFQKLTFSTGIGISLVYSMSLKQWYSNFNSPITYDISRNRKKILIPVLFNFNLLYTISTKYSTGISNTFEYFLIGIHKEALVSPSKKNTLYQYKPSFLFIVNL